MKKTFISLIIVFTFLFSGCTDYKAQIEDLQTTVSNLKETIEDKDETIEWLQRLNREKSNEITELKAKLATPTVPSGRATSSNNNTTTTVYVTNTGSKYHRLGCSYLKSCIPISLRKAIQQGYSP